MKTNRIVIALITLLLSLPLCAQHPEERDSVAVYGAISNHRTGKPVPFCTIQFLAPLPVGIYTLKVLLSGLTLYKQELLIDEAVNLNISVITDSTTIRMLPEVHVADAAPEHLLEYQELLITSPSDPRLWAFSYRWWVPGPKPVPHEARRDLSGMWCGRKP